MPGYYDSLLRKNSLTKFLGKSNDFQRQAPNSFSSVGGIGADPNNLARTADQVSEYFERVVIAGGAIILEDGGMKIRGDGTNYVTFIEDTDGENAGYFTGLQLDGYHQTHLFAIAPVGSTEEALLHLIASNAADGTEAYFDLKSDAKAQMNLSGLAAANQIFSLEGVAYEFKESTAPSTPSAGYGLAYLGTDKLWHGLNADGDDVLGGAWASYTPTLTNVTQGNGTLDFSYLQIGAIVFVTGSFVMGSTSSISGSIGFSLPVDAVDTNMRNFSCRILDSGTVGYIGLVDIAAANRVDLLVQNAAATYLRSTNANATIPMTWTTSDAFDVFFAYRATGAAAGGGGGSPGTPGSDGPNVATAVETTDTPAWNNWTAARLNTVDNSAASYGATDTVSGFMVAKTFGFSIPGGATIDGIEVRIYAVSTGHQAQSVGKLSWDGGSTHTSTKSFTPNGNPQWYTLGGAADTWGRTWSDTDFSDANFRVAIQRSDDTPTPPASWSTSNTTYIDKIQVTVYYST